MRHATSTNDDEFNDDGVFCATIDSFFFSFFLFFNTQLLLQDFLAIGH